MKIKASVRISPNGYGFGHDWTLVIEKDGMPRTFMLGQDVKYCSRVGLEPSSIVAALGSNDLKDPKINEQLAWLIMENLSDEDPEEVAEKIYDNLESWELSCE